MGGQQRQDRSRATLGDVVYANRSAAAVVEQDWIALVEAIARGDQPALHALYDRTHRLVFTLIVRITRNREAAEELTIDVFHDVWRRAGGYDASNGTVLGWVMNQARSRAIDRLRYEHRKKRVMPHSSSPALDAELEASAQEVVESQQQHRTLRATLGVLTAEEKQAIEAAFFGELTHAEVARQLDQPLGTIKTRIRSGLQKLRHALVAGTNEP